MDAAEKEQQILDQKIAVEGEPLTQIEEFNILMGQGIEFKTGNITFIIPNIKIRDYYKMMEFEERQAKARSGVDVLEAQIDFISRFTKASKDELLDNLDKQDCEKILALMFYSWIEGKNIFKKKMLRYSEVWEKILFVRKLGTLTNAG